MDSERWKAKKEVKEMEIIKIVLYQL